MVWLHPFPYYSYGTSIPARGFSTLGTPFSVKSREDDVLQWKLEDSQI